MVQVKLKLGGIKKVLRSHPVQSEVARLAKRMSDAAGEGFEYVVKPHRYTARAFVQTKDAAGARRQAKEHVLERVVGGQ